LIVLFNVKCETHFIFPLLVVVVINCFVYQSGFKTCRSRFACKKMCFKINNDRYESCNCKNATEKNIYFVTWHNNLTRELKYNQVLKPAFNFQIDRLLYYKYKIYIYIFAESKKFYIFVTKIIMSKSQKLNVKILFFCLLKSIINQYL